MLKYKQFLEKNGINEKISKVILSNPESFGELNSQQVEIKIEFKNPQQPPLNLFAKEPSTNSINKKMMKEVKAFEKEAQFYNKYIPKAKALCEKNGRGQLMDIYPIFYYADEKLIVLENLVLEGYSMQVKEGMMEFEDAKAALLTLAKHHAISFAMIREHGGREHFLNIFKNFHYECYNQPQLKKMMKHWWTNGIENCVKLVEKFPIAGGDLAVARLKADEKSIFENILQPLDYSPEEDSLAVLNHGDYWKNNMMAVRNKKGQIEHHKVIDFQVLRFSSPGIDLGYFLYTSVKPEVIIFHMNCFLNFYFSNLKTITEDLGHPIGISFEQFFLNFRSKFKHGFWLGFAFNFTSLEDFKGFDDDDISSGNGGEQTDENFEKYGKAVKQIVDLMDHYYQLKLD